ncbi:hypothetical protein SAMN04487820_103395 [Actinopolyspora mzabensis]|uniref:Uncharacterized protein n=1 Tax=Actinopolyspora mzabensis TaxID=995066 RepID=A0A1G8YF77_ACTMZ|nr:hypothetical protein [Actinopolyspora mzabensis]SDK00865.1 hypothetical protein SAMN04487820_103395 [Actinopolyspora mzabensis]
MPIDPFADIGRRAWIDCPSCHHGRDCSECLRGRSCSDHWQYLLSNSGTLLYLQCPSCTHLWQHDTHGGRTERKC